MKTRTAVAFIALLTAALTACGKSEADRQADCQKVIDGTSTVTDRPEACQDLSAEDYRTLLTDWVRKNKGVIGPGGTVDAGK
ncbi:hypothetical protein [Streptomyces sp. NPDC058256]|uniref:hypothetical protein n=1 Tax=Streptomyces sp. NPDC058256 TaxID=3346408 RepID=UPI0036E368C1